MTRTACLVGNGLSVSFNEALAVNSLTATLLAEFAASGHDDLRVLANSVSSADGGFEDLLGPFDSVAVMLQALPGFQSLIDRQVDPLLAAALQRTHDFATDIYRSGVGIVLQHIAALARAEESEQLDEHVLGFCASIADLGSPESITVATLNYDGLLHAGFLNERPAEPGGGWNLETAPVAPITDLGSGYLDAIDHHEVIPGINRAIEGRRLRELDNLKPGCLALLQLHGSLGWLRSPLTDEVWKFNLEDLRSINYWHAWRSGTTDWTPEVVLTNQKGAVTARYPYRLAYSMFEDRLTKADRWLIAGCALRDEPIQQVFRVATASRARQRKPEARCLVIGSGRNKEGVEAQVQAVTGLSTVVVAEEGLPGAMSGPEWEAWAAS